jgi:hypothetical protein
MKVKGVNKKIKVVNGEIVEIPLYINELYWINKNQKQLLFNDSIFINNDNYDEIFEYKRVLYLFNMISDNQFFVIDREGILNIYSLDKRKQWIKIDSKNLSPWVKPYSVAFLLNPSNINHTELYKRMPYNFTIKNDIPNIIDIFNNDKLHSVVTIEKTGKITHEFIKQ